jgi:threonine dehydratase
VITFQEIEAARERIAGAIYYSPCPLSIPLSEIAEMEIFCKFDNLQRTGSFKERGARNALAQLSAWQMKRGVTPPPPETTRKHSLIKADYSAFRPPW